jgi:hypothetical protein
MTFAHRFANQLANHVRSQAGPAGGARRTRTFPQ